MNLCRRLVLVSEIPLDLNNKNRVILDMAYMKWNKTIFRF